MPEPAAQPSTVGVLPIGVTTAQSTPLDVWRNRSAGRLANAALRLGTPQYRAFIGGSIRYGLQAAVADTEPDPPSPLKFPCRDCGAPVGRRCEPLPDEHPDAIGYHHTRYDDAGWPPDEEDR